MKLECDTRQKLLSAAMVLMWQSSYGSVSVDDICFKAGVRKGSFYHFFPSKCDLTVAAVSCLWEQSKHRYDQIFSPQTPPLERFNDYFNFLIESQKKKLAEYGKVCGCPYFTLGSEMSTQEERIRLKIQQMAGNILRYYETTLCELMQDGVIPPEDPARKAQEILAFLSGAILQAKVSNSLAPLLLVPNGVGLLLGVSLTTTDEALV